MKNRYKNLISDIQESFKFVVFSWSILGLVAIDQQIWVKTEYDILESNFVQMSHLIFAYA